MATELPHTDLPSRRTVAGYGLATLAGLVASDDLCDKRDVRKRDYVDGMKRSPPRFMRSCQRDFYQKRGIHPSDHADDREDRDHVKIALLANMVLSLFALIGAGVAIRKREG